MTGNPNDHSKKTTGFRIEQNYPFSLLQFLGQIFQIYDKCRNLYFYQQLMKSLLPGRGHPLASGL